MMNSHWACEMHHVGRGIKIGDHNVAWGCVVADKHNPIVGPKHCSSCKAAYKKHPNPRQYAPTFHYDCDLAAWEHDPPGRRGALGGHRDGCRVKEGHAGGAGQKCYGCRMMYLGRKDNDAFLGRWMDHPHYACALSANEHPPARGTGRGHRPGCAVAEGHDAGSAKTCPVCLIARDAKGKLRAATLMHRFGITPTQYDSLLKAQNDGCAICGKVNPNGMRLAVDHDHKTTKVRGLLCHHCNAGLGHYMDDPVLLRRAAVYVEDRE